jgi:YbgC/YbaW family acyl-CoA thioester hydrolase
MEQELSARHRVRSYELDSFGHVNNAAFFNYLEYARNEYLLQRGLTFDQFKTWDALPVVVKADVEYKHPARVHDDLEIVGRVTEWRKSRFTLDYVIFNHTANRQCLLCQMIFVFTNSRGKPVPIPEEFKLKMLL